jgi:hypothetical protein
MVKILDPLQLEALHDRYHNAGIVLAIGSGVSQASDVPTWRELLKGLARRLYGEHKGVTVFNKLIDEGYTLPAIAGMLEHYSYSQKGMKRHAFTELLRQELYEKSTFFEAGEDRDKFLHLVQDKNETLRAVASLCVKRNKAGVYVRNPLIRAIVNFNFDAILRQYVQRRYGAGKRRILRTIERPSAGARPNLIPVYHLHGYLVFDKRKFRRLTTESPDLRVFTEQEYFDSFNQPTRMGSYTVLHLLREHSWLFIGLSLRDDNIRRLLHYSLTEREAGYIAEGKDPEYAASRSARHFALLRQAISSDVSAELDALTELSLGRLGTRTIWYSEHGEVTSVLRGMYGEAEWKGVY